MTIGEARTVAVDRIVQLTPQTWVAAPSMAETDELPGQERKRCPAIAGTIPSLVPVL